MNPRHHWSGRVEKILTRVAKGCNSTGTTGLWGYQQQPPEKWHPYCSHTDHGWILGTMETLGPMPTPLKSTYGVDLITVGVDGYSTWQLEALATSPDHVLKYDTFTKFRELALYIRGGKTNYFSLK